jgi:3-hydroxyisobutyrate dehydrogenase-like beta-hydroxyacid dehydrogenase
VSVENEKPLCLSRIGFAGLGLMGRPMALHLADAGADLAVWNRTRAVAEGLGRESVKICDSPADLAERSEIIVLMLADTPAVEQVLFGADGVADGVRPGSLVIDMGTTAVMPTREFADKLAAQDVGYVDAPVSGGQIGAVEATLTIMAGGSAADIEHARPLFEVLGKKFTHVGGVGAGQVAKAANQVIVGLNIGAVAEAFALADAAGVDLAKVREALMGGFADSRILEVHGQRMIDKSFAPGGKVVTQHKDMRQAVELGERLGQELPATELGMRLYQQLIDAGDGELDHSALIRAIRPQRN